MNARQRMSRTYLMKAATNKRTTAAQDRAYLAERLQDANRRWAVGDVCRAYRGDAVTKIASVDGDIVTLENGDALHVSNVRRAQ